MNLNGRARHCVLTLIYSLYKWVNKYREKTQTKTGALEKAHHRPTREETGGGLSATWVGWRKLHVSTLCFKGISEVGKQRIKTITRVFHK